MHGRLQGTDIFALSGLGIDSCLEEMTRLLAARFLVVVDKGILEG